MIFLFLTRLVSGKPEPITLNVAHIVAIHPASDFHYGSGKHSEASGADIWTTLTDTTEGPTAWRVAEDYQDVIGKLAALGARA
jgi:hypothetical protein